MIKPSVDKRSVFCYTKLGMENYKTQLEKNGVIAFVPGGNSMWPTLKNRGQSVIIVKKEQKLKALDVAFYQRADGTFVLHRVIKVTDFGYYMLGDSQVNPEKVEEEQVFGVMQGFYSGKKSIECTDEKYIESVKKWYGNPKRRKRKLKFFYLRVAIKRRLKKLFCKGK